MGKKRNCSDEELCPDEKKIAPMKKNDRTKKLLGWKKNNIRNKKLIGQNNTCQDGKKNCSEGNKQFVGKQKPAPIKTNRCPISFDWTSYGHQYRH